MAQAAAWSPSTNGPLSGPVVLVTIRNESDFARYKGTLAEKIVLLANTYKVESNESTSPREFTDEQLSAEKKAPWENSDDDLGKFLDKFFRDTDLRGKTGEFLASEHVLAVVEMSHNFGLVAASGNTIYDDNLQGLGWFVWKREQAMKVPVVITTAGSYGRMARLLDDGVPVELQLNVDVSITGDHQHGYNTIAEIPGTDPSLKDQVVMLGAHLDSNPAATGATDNGAGTAVAMEVIRILTALNVHPRRTIRIALWSGEEQGLLGSESYARQHFASFSREGEGKNQTRADFGLPPIGNLTIKPEQRLISGYFNLDNGSGKIRGIYAEGNQAVASLFDQWIAPLKDLGVTAVTLRKTALTDHTSFNEVGIPGFQFIQDPLDYETGTHHSNLDDYDHLSVEGLRQAAVVEAIFVYNTAMRDEMLPRQPLPEPQRDRQMRRPLNLLPEAAARAAAAK